MTNNLDEQGMKGVQYPNLPLNSDLGYEAGQDAPKPKNPQVGLSGVFSKDTMEIASESSEKIKVKQTQPDLLTWLLSFFYTSSPSVPQTEAKTTHAKGVDFSKPTLRKPETEIETRQINNFIKNLKAENAQRKQTQEERSLDQQVIDMLINIRTVKQTLADTTSSEVVENHKKNSLKKKEQQQLIEKSLNAGWLKNWLGKVQTGLGAGSLLLTLRAFWTGAAQVDPMLGLILTASQVLLTASQAASTHKHNNLQVESIYNEKEITANKEAIKKWLDNLKAMLTAVSKTEEMTIKTLQKHHDAVIGVMDKQ